jgi:hypothetical protein
MPVDNVWSKPVTVRLQKGLHRTFHSLESAIDFLEDEWPTRPGRHGTRALNLCRAAQTRLVSRETAREAFIAACIEANLPLVMTAPARLARVSTSLAPRSAPSAA